MTPPSKDYDETRYVEPHHRLHEGDINDYTGLSKDYDETRYVEPHHRLHEEMRRTLLLSMLELQPHMRVADIACGTGRGVLMMAPYVKHVTGVDGTPAMLERAKEKAKAEGFDSVDFLVQDAFHLDLPDNCFDRVISLNFLHLFLPVARQAQLVKEMVRILKPGGKLLIELDNALHAGPVGVFRKYFVFGPGYNWPWDIGRIVAPSGAKIEKVAGSNIPGLWRLRMLTEELPKRLEARLQHTIMRYVMRRLQVLCIKTS